MDPGETKTNSEYGVFTYRQCFGGGVGGGINAKIYTRRKHEECALKKGGGKRSVSKTTSER